MRGGEKKRAARKIVPLFWLKIASCNIGLQLLDLLSHGVVLYTITKDDELTITNYLLDICVVGGNIIYRRCGLGCKLARMRLDGFVKDGTLFMLYERKNFEKMTSRKYEYLKGFNGHFEIALYVDSFEEVDVSFFIASNSSLSNCYFVAL